MIELNKRPLSEIEKPIGGWTQEIIDCAKQAKSNGLSASQIANRIERRFGVIFTRNSIIGMLRRLQKNPNQKPNRTARRVPARSAPVAPPPGHPLHGLPLIVVKKTAPQTPSGPRTPEPAPILRADGQPHILPSLPRGACKWPVAGEGKLTQFCAAPQREEGAPYCEFHMRLATQRPVAKEAAQ